MSKLVPLTCPSCGARLKAPDSRGCVTCEHCGSVSLLSLEQPNMSELNPVPVKAEPIRPALPVNDCNMSEPQWNEIVQQYENEARQYFDASVKKWALENQINDIKRRGTKTGKTLKRDMGNGGCGLLFWIIFFMSPYALS